MGKAIDTYRCDRAIQMADRMKADGITAVGLYYFHSSKFKQLLTRPVARALSAHGLYVFSVWEDGFPTKGGYFTAAQGRIDGQRAQACALAAGQPAGTPIYAAVDYDASVSDLTGITAYFTAYRAALAVSDYTAGVYGSGLVCRHLSDLGLTSHTWLSESKGFTGYQSWLPHADIVQGHSCEMYGMDVDTDTTNGHGGGWQVPA